MQVNEAVSIAKHVRKALEMAGPYADVPYSQGQLCEALLAFHKIVGDEPVSREEHVKVIRQITAANARLAGYEKRGAAAQR